MKWGTDCIVMSWKELALLLALRCAELESAFRELENAFEELKNYSSISE